VNPLWLLSPHLAAVLLGPRLAARLASGSSAASRLELARLSHRESRISRSVVSASDLASRDSTS
jgi:hypothetical protein